MAVFGMISTQASRKYTFFALRSFFEVTPVKGNDRLILIINDGEFVLPADLQHFPIEVRRNSVPLSFAANANALARQALDADTDLFILNNDVIFSEAWIEPVLAGPRAVLIPISNAELQYTLEISGSEPYQLPMRMELEHYLGHEEHFRMITKLHRSESSRVIPYLKVLCMPFFAVRIPIEVIAAIGGFDLRYGIGGGEDYDYCMRAWLAGFSVECARCSFLLHFGGRSIGNLHKGSEAEFIRIFRERWGDELARFAFDDAHQLSEPHSDYQREGFREFVLSRVGQNQGNLHFSLLP